MMIKTVWCWYMVCVLKSSTLCDTMDCSSPGSSAYGDSPGKNTGVGCPPPGDLPTPVIEPRSPALQVDSLPLSHQGSPQIWNVSWICVSSLHRGHANLLCFIPILVYVLNSRLISVLITKLKPPYF